MFTITPEAYPLLDNRGHFIVLTFNISPVCSMWFLNCPRATDMPLDAVSHSNCIKHGLASDVNSSVISVGLEPIGIILDNIELRQPILSDEEIGADGGNRNLISGLASQHNIRYTTSA
jgi:hypothetical protein